VVTAAPVRGGISAVIRREELDPFWVGRRAHVFDQRCR
jgi:hypothetical protein